MVFLFFENDILGRIYGGVVAFNGNNTYHMLIQVNILTLIQRHLTVGDGRKSNLNFSHYIR